MRDLDLDISYIIVTNVFSYAQALILPVYPNSKGRTPVDIVTLDNYIDRRVKLNAAKLVSPELLLYRYVVDIIVFNTTENTSKVTDNTALTAVVYLIVSYDVRADSFLLPPLLECFIGSLCLISMSRFLAFFSRKIFTLKSIASDTYRATF